MGLWLSLASQLLDLVSPPTCAACDAPSGVPFCANCGMPAPMPLDEYVAGVPLLVAGSYAPPLSTAVVRFKYGARPELSRPLSRLLVQQLKATLPAGVTLVPVPLHPHKLATRGYNQAALLAQELARATGHACSPRLLMRTRQTSPQVGKLRSERLTNTHGAFQLRRPGPPRVALVDDVVTTGATVRACAQALMAGGVELTRVVALARAEPGSKVEAGGAAPALISL